MIFDFIIVALWFIGFLIFAICGGLIGNYSLGMIGYYIGVIIGACFYLQRCHVPLEMNIT